MGLLGVGTSGREEFDGKLAASEQDHERLQLAGQALDRFGQRNTQQVISIVMHQTACEACRGGTRVRRKLSRVLTRSHHAASRS